MVLKMSLRELNLKKAYSSETEDILFDFYIPVLKESIEYNRLAGFFSSTSLAVAARGVVGLIKNDGNMRLVVSPKLTKKDLQIILDTHKNPEKYIETKMLKEIENLENEFIKNHIFALGWMIANKKLEIKIAIPYDENGNILSYDETESKGIFHPKVGILKDDEGNLISFSGSVNESATGWLENIEEFKVFRSWEISEVDYLNADVLKFKKFWDGLSSKVKVIDTPKAVESKLVEIAPEDIETINFENLYQKLKKHQKQEKIKLFKHQKEAVNAWISNDMKGIFEMATGTGKTFAALGCLRKISRSIQKLLVIITCPYQHLVQQWKREMEKFGTKYDKLIIADSSNPPWKNELANSLIDLSLEHKNKIIVLTTHRTLSSYDFIRIIQQYSRDSINIFLIADEVHGLGAEKSREGLLKKYRLRLGLSATPKRWFDTIGTDVIYSYFGNVVFEFGLDKAVSNINPATGKTYLTPYRYIPKFISLSVTELEEYIDKTVNIAIKLIKPKNKEEKDDILENLLFKRANIIKNASEKYRVLEELLDELGPSLKWTIIYCSPQQIDNVMNILKKRGIIAHRFTMDQGTIPEKRYNGLSERDFILQKFAEGEYQVLVAMKCLDEGVDVPPARVAILMASSGNPREYIQRIGRVIRRYPGKNEATIYDIIVTPSFNELPSELKKIEWKIFQKELERYEEISRHAINSAEALEILYNIKNKLMGVKW